MGGVLSSEVPVEESFSEVLKGMKPKSICGWVVLPLQLIILACVLAVAIPVVIILGELLGLLQKGCLYALKGCTLGCLFCCL